MKCSRWLGPCAITLALALAACSDGGGSSNGGSGEEPSEGAFPECDAYLECVLDTAPEAYGAALELYGPNSDCRSSTDEAAASCEQACRDAKANAREAFPDVASCSPGSSSGGGEVHTVSGTIQIVNGSGATSVILVEQSAFNPEAPVMMAPDGLQAPNVTGAWSISGVPNGSYWALVAFENDGLVLDPAVATAFSVVVVPGEDVVVPGSFKVTGALQIVSPNAGAIVSGTPTFVWQDDSSESSYAVRVVDQAGGVVWQTSVPPESGGDVVVPYGGPALAPGIYQLRVTSMSSASSPISRSEDLAGTFQYE